MSPIHKADVQFDETRTPTGKVRVKICGITSVADALSAVNAGADAIGLAFYAPSSRNISIDLAAQIARVAGPFVTVTGLFVDAKQDTIEEILQRVPLHLLQFHGDETPEFCQRFQRPFIKAIRMREGVDLASEFAAYSRACGILLDACRPGLPGGTGEVFDWQRVPRSPPCPIVLAGGLNPDNVADAIKTTNPWGVDVSSGVEQSPGIKDPHKVATFIRNVCYSQCL